MLDSDAEPFDYEQPDDDRTLQSTIEADNVLQPNDSELTNGHK